MKGFKVVDDLEKKLDKASEIRSREQGNEFEDLKMILRIRLSVYSLKLKAKE